MKGFLTPDFYPKMVSFRKSPFKAFLGTFMETFRRVHGNVSMITRERSQKVSETFPSVARNVPVRKWAKTGQFDDSSFCYKQEDKCREFLICWLSEVFA